MLSLDHQGIREQPVAFLSVTDISCQCVYSVRQAFRKILVRLCSRLVVFPFSLQVLVLAVLLPERNVDHYRC